MSVSTLPPQTPASSLPAQRAAATTTGDDPPDPFFEPQRTLRTALPDPRQWAARLVQVVLEVLAGERPASQLAPFTSEDVLAALRQRTPSGAGWPPPAPRHAASPPAGEGVRRHTRSAVRSVHVREPVDGVAETCVVMHDGSRMRALALRLEGLDGRWRCTALQLA